MSALSMSALPRAAVCAGSVVLPQAKTASVYSDAGHQRHSISELAIKSGELGRIPPEVRTLIPLGALVHAEVRIAYDWRADTGRLLEQPYTLGGTEIAGQVDMLIVRDGRHVTVLDYKGHEDVGAPDENEQLMGYAIAAARAFAAESVSVVIAYVEEIDGSLVLRRPLVQRSIDALDLDAYASRLAGIAKSVDRQREQSAARGVPDVRESRHCKYCPAIPYCPAKTALIKRLASGGEADELETMIPLSPETAAIAWQRLGYAESLLNRIRNAIYAYASETTVPLSNGMVLGKRTKRGNEQLDADIVYEVVRARYGQQIADTAVIREATKVRLRDALRFVGAKSLAGAEREVLAEVGARGGISRPTKEVVDEHRPELEEGKAAP